MAHDDPRRAGRRPAAGAPDVDQTAGMRSSGGAGRPRVVIVTGEPGSGKSTLGAELARALRVPFLARDDVRGGMFLTAGAWTGSPFQVPDALEAVDAFLGIVEAMAAAGVSCVVEYVVRRARPQDLDRLTAVGDCVVIVTSCPDASERVARRNVADRLLTQDGVLDALGFVSIDDHTAAAVTRANEVRDAMRTEFDLPVLHVRTDAGYHPGLEEIIDFATRP